MPKGCFIDFPLFFGHGTPGALRNDDQVATIITAARWLLDQGQSGVAITYSANQSQTRALIRAYASGEATAGIGGANQARVVSALEDQLDGPAQDLALKLRIAPITTIPDDEDKLAQTIERDLDRIDVQLAQGWAILGWQNQISLGNVSGPYAVGGGIRQLPPEIDDLIQSRLMQMAAAFPAPKALPKPWPPAIDG